MKIKEISKDIVISLRRYKNCFFDEASDFSELECQIIDGEDITSRKNMRGHVTASGLVISPEGEALLIFHKANQMWHQPGGHIDKADESIVCAAMREICEETSLKDIELHPWHDRYQHPIDIDTHAIAVRPEKSEGPHFHHDFLYLFKTKKSDVIIQPDEIESCKWIHVSAESEIPIHTRESFRKILKYNIV